MDSDAAPARLAAHSAAARAVSYLVGIPGSIYLARGLGPEGRGLYQLPVTAVSVFFFVSALGVPQALLRFWKPDRLEALRRTTTMLAIGIGAAGMAVGAVVFAAQQGGVFDGVPLLAYWLVLWSLPLQLHLGAWSALLIYSGSGRTVNTASALAVVFQSAAFVVAGAMHWLTVTRTCAIYLAGVALQWLWVAVRTRRLTIAVPQGAAPAWWSLIATGVRFQPYVLANFLLLRMDIFLLAHLSTLDEVGRYAVAVALAEIVWGVTDAIQLPAIERASNSEDAADTEFSVTAVRMTLLLGGLAAVTVAASAPLVVPVLYGEAFGGAVAPLLVLLPGIIFMGAWRVGSLSTVRFASPMVQPAISTAALVINAGLNILLIPELGAVGASLASSASYLFVMRLTLRWIVRSGGVSWRELIPGRSDVARMRRLPRLIVGS